MPENQQLNMSRDLPVIIDQQQPLTIQQELNIRDDHQTTGTIIKCEEKQKCTSCEKFIRVGQGPHEGPKRGGERCMGGCRKISQRLI